MKYSPNMDYLKKLFSRPSKKIVSKPVEYAEDLPEYEFHFSWLTLIQMIIGLVFGIIFGETLGDLLWFLYITSLCSECVPILCFLFTKKHNYKVDDPLNSFFPPIILKAIFKSLCGSKLTIVDVPGMIFWFGGWYYLLGTALIDYYPFSVNLSCFLFLVPFGLLSGYKRIVEAKKHGDGHLHLTMLPSFLTILRLCIAMMFIMVKRIDFSSSEILYYIGLYAWFFIPIKFTRKTEDMVLSNLAENKVKVKKKPEVTPMPVPPAPSLLWWRRRRKRKNNINKVF
ncbi:MAG: hypothetical protein IKV03_06365 [Alphaproteobacteria bacterium]|nr:hypothetical protein [Alphaproteobacteria bacterium]